jgi:hypothetical protein
MVGDNERGEGMAVGGDGGDGGTLGSIRTPLDDTSQTYL